MALLAHVDAGKTTLAESILYHTGSIRKMGRVDHQDTFLDTDSMERARGITIFSKQAGFRLGEKSFTPSGYAGACGFFSRNGENLAGARLRSAAYQRRRRCPGACADPLAAAETV